MAETLGSLCDKLTIVKLKQYHSDDSTRLESLSLQAVQLQEEIDGFVINAIHGKIPLSKLTFKSNKVFKKDGNEIPDVVGGIGQIFYQLADVNCKLWHEVEKGYDIENVPSDEKDQLVKMLAILNLERNKCIDEIDNFLLNLLSKQKINR